MIVSVPGFQVWSGAIESAWVPAGRTMPSPVQLRPVIDQVTSTGRLKVQVCATSLGTMV